LPFTFPRRIKDSDKVALVLTFGRLSVLEACSVLEGLVVNVENPCERVSVLTLKGSSYERLQDLAGVHKVAPVVAVSGGLQATMAALMEDIAEHIQDKMTLAVSGYEINRDEYEFVIRLLLDCIKEAGFSKTRLLRPRNNELLAETVQSRSALDIIAFPYRGGIGLGPTTWIPDSASMRKRGIREPTRHSDISMPPRLAQVLLNLSGLQKGQIVLDPFCGSGTILAEAFVRSIKCWGLDISANRVKDARKNLRGLTSSFNDRGYDIRVGDARETSRLLRGSMVDAVVTEPFLLPKIEARPKAATAALLVGQAGQVYGDALRSVVEVLRPGGRIVMVVPVIQTMDGEEVSLILEGRDLGLRLFQPGPTSFRYPVRLSFESTRWVRRAVYIFEKRVPNVEGGNGFPKNPSQ